VSDRAEPFKVRFAVPTGGIRGGNPKTHAGESGWPVCMLHTLYRGVCMPVVWREREAVCVWEARKMQGRRDGVVTLRLTIVSRSFPFILIFFLM
jgi:hypothetical protein